ncbi:hypothetical protein KKF81_03005 [Candidatus Micrarchaeota archaeon]|nr:hypothetical protein [Candidatus Micrarchaeota archaeon]
MENLNYMYKDRSEKEKVFFRLLSGSIRYFKDAYIISNLSEFERVLQLDIRNWDCDVYNKFTDEKLIDTVRIVISFENYFKAKLVRNDYLIHLLNKKSVGKQAFNISNPVKKPVKYTDLVENVGVVDEKILNHRTIGFNDLLSPDYRDVLGIPSDVGKILKDIADYRNSLHFKSFPGEIYLSTYVKDMKKLIDFVNYNMIEEYNAIVVKYYRGTLFPRPKIEY